MQQLSSLYLRLMMPLGATLLVAMAFAWAIALTLMSNVINERLDSRLDTAVTILGEGNFPLSPDLLRRLDLLIGARIVLLDADGRSAADTAGETGRAQLAPLLESLPLTGEGGVQTAGSGEQSWRVALRPLPSARDDRYRYVAAAAPLAETRSAVRDAAGLLAAAMLVAALVLALLASFFIRSIARPVTRLAVVADRLAEGERDIDTGVDEKNEIGVLARALSELAARLKGYESRLARQSRLSALGDLAARVAHEVRNPLTAMKMQLQMLEERASDADRPRFRSVVDEMRRLELVVESTLALGSSQKLQRVTTDLPALVDEVADMLEPSFAHRHIRLARITAELPPLSIDPDRIKQVLLNLLNNAADEIVGEGEIRITVSGDDKQAFIGIEDSGPGMPESAGRSSKPFGLGLGLTISHEIIESHGGELQHARSEALGGASFTICLPLPIMNRDDS